MNTHAISQSQHGAALVAAACRYIEQAESPPSLAALARMAGLGVHAFHRLFKTATGLTPKMYAQAHRGKVLREALAKPGTKVADAAFDAGFNASSRFYDSADTLLGMTPTQFRNGGSQVQIVFAIGQCSLGALLVARSARGLCAIALGDDPGILLRELQDRFPRAELMGGDADFEQQLAQVAGLIEAPQLGLGLPLDIRGTAFQQRVWEALRKIPAGKTVSYAELAEAIGAPRAVRAVAGACAANTLAVAIPCHRVVRSDGGLSGYRWGVARKQALLSRESGAGSMRGEMDIFT